MANHTEKHHITQKQTDQIVGICTALQIEPEDLRDTLLLIYPVKQQEQQQQAAAEKDLPQLLTRKEAAEYLKVDVQTIDRRRKEGLLKSVNTGRQILIPTESIKKYLFGAAS